MFDINNGGVTVGWSAHKGCRWDAGGNPTELPTLAGYVVPEVWAVNDAGWAAGIVSSDYMDPANDPVPMKAVKWSPYGDAIGLADLPGLASRAWDINNVGQVAGKVYLYPVVWSPGGSYTSLPGLEGMPYGDAFAINDFGQVVGGCYDGGASPGVPVVWEVVPEPASLACLACGLAGSVAFGLRRKRQPSPTVV